MKRISLLHLLLLLLLFCVPTFAQNFEFTYQGRLAVNSIPTTTAHDFEFRLYASETPNPPSESTLGLPQVRLAVPVSNGVFTVNLNFGNQFQGVLRWLEIRVKPAGGPTYTTLTPRQKVSPAPEGIFSLFSDTATNASMLGGVAASQYVLTTDSRMTDSRMPTAGSGNYIQNRTTPQLSPPSNFNISGNGTVGGTLSGNIVEARDQFRIGGVPVLRMPKATNLWVGTPGNLTSLGFGNILVGPGTGISFEAATGNAFFGYNTGANTVTGSFNSFFGSTDFSNTGTGRLNVTGSFNSFFGHRTGENNNGDTNSFFGTGAGLGNTDGDSNTFIGHDAGNFNTLGSFNTTLGENADVGANNLTNATAIGSKAHVTQSNSLVLGSINGINGATANTNVGIGTTAPAFKLQVVDSLNTGLRVQTNTAGGTVASFGSNGAFQIDNAFASGGRFTVLENGRVGIGTSLPTRSLEVTGIVAFNLSSGGGANLCHNFNSEVSTCGSSIRYKQNINGFSSGIDLINRLRPVTFDWKANNKADMGLVAEEVAEIEPLLATYNDKGEVEGVKYDRIGVVLINVVKEQQAQIEAQKELIENQQKQIDALRRLVCQGNRGAGICKK